MYFRTKLQKAAALLKKMFASRTVMKSFSSVRGPFSRPTHAKTLKCTSNQPENAVCGGPKLQNPNQRVKLTHLRQKHRRGEPITMVTAYDYPSAVHLELAGIDICLVVTPLPWSSTATTPPSLSLSKKCLSIAAPSLVAPSGRFSSAIFRLGRTSRVQSRY